MLRASLLLPGTRLPLASPLNPFGFCTSVVSFVPETGRAYVIRFPEVPDGGKQACGVTAEAEGAARNNWGPAESIAYPHALRGAEAFQSGGLCALGAK